MQAQAKAKAKTYEFRSDSSRGIRVPYPGRSPQELGSTSRAREGLRNIALAPQGSSSSSTPKADGIRDRVIRVEEKPGETPKKRGPKPRKELYKDLAETLDASKRKLGDPGDKMGERDLKRPGIFTVCTKSGSVCLKTTSVLLTFCVSSVSNLGLQQQCRSFIRQM